LKNIRTISRRSFLKKSTIAAAGTTLVPLSAIGKANDKFSWKEARYYQKLSDNKVRCTLCPWQCLVSDGKRGHCDVRLNNGGKYYSLVYGRVSAHHNDPIEKKPFYHFLPGTTAFSIATTGCNVDCKFCQNWELAQRMPEDVYSVNMSPGDIIRYAKQWDCKSIAYTYNEPTIFTEFIYDIAARSKENGIRNVIISNGFINKKPLMDLCKVIDGYKVDLKGFTQEFYSNVVSGILDPVLETLVTLKSEGIWTEIVYLVVPTLNDNLKDIKKMVKWLYNELGPEVPIHFSRFYPKYKLKNLPPTPVATLERARNAGLEAGLHYVYMGNIPGHKSENTYCPGCKKILIGRVGYRIFNNKIKNGKCDSCGHQISGFWE
jgi:pyruvate formate lyase activating enzyme